MPRCGSIISGIIRKSYGTHFLDHLAAHRTGLAGSQIAVVSLLQVNAYLVGGLHLELVHCLAGIGDHDLVSAVVVIAGHNVSLLFVSVFISSGVRMERPHISLPEDDVICDNSIARFCGRKWTIMQGKRTAFNSINMIDDKKSFDKK